MTNDAIAGGSRLLSPDEAAARAGVDVETIHYLIEYGQLNGTAHADGMRVLEKDLDFYVFGMQIEKDIARANRTHPGRGWILGNCSVCERMIPEPTVPRRRWACSAACAATDPAAELVPSY